jgi:hypothetical protein
VTDRNVERLEERQAETAEKLGEVSLRLATVSTDVAWLKRTYWLIAGASVGSLIAALWQLASRAS